VREGRSRRELKLTVSRPSLPFPLLYLLQYITANVRNVFGGAETFGLSTSVGTKTRSSFEVSPLLVPFPSVFRVDEPKSDLFISSSLLLTPGNSPNASVRFSFTLSRPLRLLVRSRQHGVRISLGAGSRSEAQLRREFSVLPSSSTLCDSGTDSEPLRLTFVESVVPWRSLSDIRVDSTDSAKPPPFCFDIVRSCLFPQLTH